FATLRRDPVDVLVRVLDVTSLAVDAILRVDDEARILDLWIGGGVAVRIDPFVDADRAISCRGAGEDVVLGPLLQIHITDDQVYRLVFFVVCIRQVNGGGSVEGEHAVRLRVVDLVVFRGGL